MTLARNFFVVCRFRAQNIRKSVKREAFAAPLVVMELLLTDLGLEREVAVRWMVLGQHRAAGNRGKVAKWLRTMQQLALSARVLAHELLHLLMGLSRNKLQFLRPE